MCDTPLIIRKSVKVPNGKKEVAQIPVKCGKCPPCQNMRLRQWIFRLCKEDEVSTSSYFVTLTYANHSVPRSKKNFKTLRKKDLQNFFKRLRRLEKNKIRYYAVGEYGTTNKRPHYHIILFNVENKDNIIRAWTLNKQPIGTIDVGTVTGKSIAYTCKYLHKPTIIPKFAGDDRKKEFSVMSKGIGKNYYEDQQVLRYHKNNLNNYFVLKDGYKIAMPKHFRQKIYTPGEIIQQNEIIKNESEKRENEKQIEYEKQNNKKPYEYYKDSEKRHKLNKFNKTQKNRDVQN